MNKAKKLLPINLSDCKKEYDKDGKNRYVIIDSLAIQIPLFLCETYEEAEETIESFRKFELYPSSIIVDLEEWGEWKPVYDKVDGRMIPNEYSHKIGVELIKSKWSSHWEIVQAFEIGRIGETIFIDLDEAREELEKQRKMGFAVRERI